jgi:hypothetical protein
MKDVDVVQTEKRKYLLRLDIYWGSRQKCMGGASQVLLGKTAPANLRAKRIRVPDVMDRPLFSMFSHDLEVFICTESADAMGAGALLRNADNIPRCEVIAADDLAQKLARSLSATAAKSIDIVRCSNIVLIRLW